MAAASSTAPGLNGRWIQYQRRPLCAIRTRVDDRYDHIHFAFLIDPGHDHQDFRGSDIESNHQAVCFFRHGYVLPDLGPDADAVSRSRQPIAKPFGYRKSTDSISGNRASNPGSGHPGISAPASRSAAPRQSGSYMHPCRPSGHPGCRIHPAPQERRR